jgi:hypothetical protein
MTSGVYETKEGAKMSASAKSREKRTFSLETRARMSEAAKKSEKAYSGDKGEDVGGGKKPEKRTRFT